MNEGRKEGRKARTHARTHARTNVHKPNTYSYREVNNNIQHIKFCSCVEKLQLH